MIGILIAAHGGMGPALQRAAEGIVGSMDRVEAVCIGHTESPSEARKQVEEAIHRLDSGDGVLILTDMFGGTPTNIALPFLEQGRVEVLTGVNLPMVIRAQSARFELDLDELAAALRDYGARNIILASEISSPHLHPPG